MFKVLSIYTIIVLYPDGAPSLLRFGMSRHNRPSSSVSITHPFSQRTRLKRYTISFSALTHNSPKRERRGEKMVTMDGMQKDRK